MKNVTKKISYGSKSNLTNEFNAKAPKKIKIESDGAREKGKHTTTTKKLSSKAGNGYKQYVH